MAAVSVESSSSMGVVSVESFSAVSVEFLSSVAAVSIMLKVSTSGNDTLNITVATDSPVKEGKYLCHVNILDSF